MNSASPSLLRRALAIVGTALLVVAPAIGCSNGDAAQPDQTGGQTTTAAAATDSASPSTSVKSDSPPAVEQFSGIDADFYALPDPLPNGKAGDLIRTQALGDADGSTTLKIMYHTSDAQDRDRVATGLVTYPTGDPPKGGWPVIATAPGTTGVAAQCGASHTETEAPNWGVDGVRVMTDYIGLGPVGDPLHPYLSRPSEGHSVIDSVRAARQLDGANAGTQWLSVGHSQGGHGALSAMELSGEYAPELDLLGTLALAPAAMLDRVYGGIDPIVTSILTAMSLYGGATEHPEINVDDYVTPELAALSGVFETGCLDEIVSALTPLALSGGLFTADPRETEPAKSLLLVNDVGNVAVDSPLFLVSGTADDRVVIDRVRDLFARLCKVGQVTELLIVDGADHGSIIPRTAEQTSAWLQARLDGKPASNSCGN